MPRYAVTIMYSYQTEVDAASEEEAIVEADREASDRIWGTDELNEEDHYVEELESDDEGDEIGVEPAEHDEGNVSMIRNLAEIVKGADDQMVAVKRVMLN